MRPFQKPHIPHYTLSKKKYHGKISVTSNVEQLKYLIKDEMTCMDDRKLPF